jgi:hypothetical protein
MNPTPDEHEEASDFWTAYRKGTLHLPCDKALAMATQSLPELTCAEEEIADEIIRALDKAYMHGVDVAKAVSTKIAHNASRHHLHGGTLA